VETQDDIQEYDCMRRCNIYRIVETQDDIQEYDCMRRCNIYRRGGGTQSIWWWNI